MKTKILIVTATYYKNISKGLLFGTKKILSRKGSYKLAVKQIEVPGVFEIPVVISKNIKKYDGFIALGCVIKGETPHFEYISKTSINEIMKLSVQNKKPIGNGILTCLNMSQAKIRSGSKNKGSEAAKAVLSVLKNF
jgi:6,7-dimethyl-8-ribityllumazine synthase